MSQVYLPHAKVQDKSSAVLLSNIDYVGVFVHSLLLVTSNQCQHRRFSTTRSPGFEKLDTMGSRANTQTLAAI